MPARSLYICYFGLRQPLLQTQVLPYLRELLKDGHDLTLLTFEPEFSKNWTTEQLSEERERLAVEGIDWRHLPYHRRFSAAATAYDIFRGTLKVRGFIREKSIDILHGRVHVPTLMGALARKFSRRKPKLLFDIRGFFPEEYTDAGIWPENGILYRSAKRVEKWLMKEADGFVVLTEKARGILFPESKPSGYDRLGRPVEVIPCCVDMSRFGLADDSARNATRQRLGIEGRNVVVYVGSFGGWYLTDEMLDFFETARAEDPTTFALILTQREKDKITGHLRKRGFSPDDFFVESVAPDEIPAYLAASDLAVSFIKACYSKLSSSPTKIAEYLAAGLPVVANAGVGDVDDLIDSKNVGVIINDFTPKSYSRALDQIKKMNGIRSRCRETAAEEFDLEKTGGVKYRLLYDRILGDEHGREN
ncbi:MAG: glycosyltransferase family 4 protein [Acidobacteria bacterium]|nr:glycosyltransferase family 4 protein [Acidobacteriota bacterium]